jgi:hypothetical protein
MRHPEAAVRGEALMPFSLPAIVGAGRSSRERRCVRREARRGSASSKRRVSLALLAAVAAQLGVASDGRSRGILGLGTRGRKGGRG